MPRPLEYGEVSTEFADMAQVCDLYTTLPRIAGATDSHARVLGIPMPTWQARVARV